MTTDPREPYGRVVRETWVKWAREQPDPKPSWLVSWDDLDQGQREVDMRIGEAIAAAERQRIYAPDNFPGDGSVGPDEIPAEYRQTTAAYWYRRWLFMMNRLDEAPTAWDVHAAKKEGRASERRRILAVLAEHYLMTVICDEETKQDNPVCGCSRIFLGWHPSAGAARQAWIDHVADLLGDGDA